MKFLSRVTIFQSLDALIVLFIYSNKIFIYEHTSQKVQMGWYIMKAHKVNGCQVPTQLMTQRSAPFHVSTCCVKNKFCDISCFSKKDNHVNLSIIIIKRKLWDMNIALREEEGSLVQKWERGLWTKCKIINNKLKKKKKELGALKLYRAARSPVMSLLKLISIHCCPKHHWLAQDPYTLQINQLTTPLLNWFDIQPKCFKSLNDKIEQLEF